MIDWHNTAIELIFKHFNKKELLADFKQYKFANLGDYSLLFEEYKIDDMTAWHKQQPYYKYDRNGFVLTLSHKTEGVIHQYKANTPRECVLEMLGYIKVYIPEVQPTPQNIIEIKDEVCQVLQSGIYKVEFDGADGNPYWFDNKDGDISLVRFKYASGYEDYVQVRDNECNMIFESPKRQVKIFFKPL